MKFDVILSGENNGKFNMDFDIELTKSFPPNPILRLYRWKPYCISLGANQKLDEVNYTKAYGDNIDVVKRPTGGRAILHSEELTYSVVFPLELIYSAKEIYNEINIALREGLIFYDSSLSELELEHNQVDFKNFYKEDKSAICFAVSAKSEINFRNKKLVGSAQRKIGKVVLQHGSILCGDFHLKITDYLNVDDERKSQIKNEIAETTIDLRSILKQQINYEYLSECLIKGFKKHFNADVDVKEFSLQ
ncbi:MAG: lipoate--protein ligase family protein [Ignavibacterium sp.]|jgi:lipoate-protein ligase A|uniref:lipoate--protein ligase family protein n=1 Tax=Ignavibacterium sp. TaxID=2651167 RepID=UPI003299EA61